MSPRLFWLLKACKLPESINVGAVRISALVAEVPYAVLIIPAVEVNGNGHLKGGEN